MFVDLRSDTVTKPTEAMRARMAAAPVGDDVYGEDPSVNRLEATVAALLGHEAGLFTPTGSMANQLGLRLLVAPGQELVCDDDAHVVRAELGAAAVLSGITTRTWRAARGLLDVDAVAPLLRPDAGPYLVSTAAVAVENTHNFGGGTVQPLAELRRLRQVTRDAGVGLHLDGARLWNASVASGVPLEDYGELFDTVSVCLSKGLGAPAGSVLVASAERVAQARVWRKRLGGGMRQVGILAAAGLHALGAHLERLADDHARARQLAEAVAEAAPAIVDPAFVETNIVPLDLAAAPVDARDLARAAKDDGVLVSVLGPRRARLVTHLDVDDDGIERAGKVLAGLLRS
ncbi:MAG: beta-eliminating lyase-related protein [Actinomycetota bacterium]|nr:beta-eliminating lyase-related protein [Actinomycetota bacterium]